MKKKKHYSYMLLIILWYAMAGRHILISKMAKCEKKRVLQLTKGSSLNLPPIYCCSNSHFLGSLGGWTYFLMSIGL